MAFLRRCLSDFAAEVAEEENVCVSCAQEEVTGVCHQILCFTMMSDDYHRIDITSVFVLPVA